MHASLNEIESLCKKAARGAGLSWGLAEEAGKAARWLSAHGLDGPGVLARSCDRMTAVPTSNWPRMSAPSPGRCPGMPCAR